MRRILTLAVVVSGISCALHAQPASAPPEQGPQVLFFEALCLPPAVDSLPPQVVLQYRLDREFLIPVTNGDPLSASPFRRRGEVLVELVDSLGSVAERGIDRIEIGENDAERGPLGREWYEGMVPLSPPPGSYSIHVTVDDLESRRNVRDQSRKIFVAGAEPGGMKNATAFLSEPVSPEGSLPATVTPMNFGGDVLFGRPSTLLITWTTASVEETTLTAKFSFATRPPAAEDESLLPTERTITAHIFHGIHLAPATQEPSSAYTLRTGGSARQCLALIPVPTEKLPLRSYELTLAISSGGEKAQLDRHFRTVWPDMPFSLKDIDYALNALRPITTSAQLDSLRSGSLEARRKNLEEFWKAKDSTPETAYNEVMTEYYRRVDYAIRNFGTLRQPDGFRSDRGKVYVVYGPPSSSERTLDPNEGYQEVWVYDRLNKKFTFVDQNKSGNYVLVSSSAL